MKKVLIVVLIAVAFISPSIAISAEQNRIQVGVVVGNTSVGGSPISVNSDSNTGASLMYIRDTAEFLDKTEVALGFARQSHSFGMSGDLGGGPDTTTASIAGRYRFLEESESPHFVPYAELGFHTTSVSSANYMNGTLRTPSATMNGTLAGLGVRVPFSDKKYYVDLGVRQYFGGTGDIRLETTTGGALATRLNMKDVTAFTLSVGGTF